MKASVLYKSNCILGEGVMWHTGRQSFFWLDIEGRKVFEYNWPDKKINHWHLPYRVSLLVQGRSDDTVLLGVQGGLTWLNPDTGKTDWLLDIEKELAFNRTNDGACDTQGRLWIGTMELTTKEGCGALYCVDTDLTLIKKLDHLTISNGITWSLNNKKMYHIDTAKATVRSYFFDEATGNISYEKIAVSVPPHMGAPDGMCMDAEGMLWIAHWGGFGVYRWDPANGMLLNKVDVPAPHVTCCAFGGKNMEQLVITTAKEGLSPQQLEEYPDSGNVFVAVPGVRGVARNRFLQL